MIQRVKRYLAAILSLAMVLTLLPPVEAKAEEIGKRRISVQVKS